MESINIKSAIRKSVNVDQGKIKNKTLDYFLKLQS